uniref:ZP domain-containing protein n=1 Tax=Panagrolaimus sp. ES5 TaxID=591445 RepID=A0AC34GUC3_9BILA
MIIPFGGGENDQCGVIFDKKTETYWVEVEVHYHNVVVAKYDQVFNVTCDNTSIIDQPLKIEYLLDLYPVPNNDNQKSTNNGNTYFLDAFVSNFDDEITYGSRYQMTDCEIKSDDKNAIEIIDSNGCSTDPKFITDIVYTNGYASANISSINPFLKMLKLKCKFSICEKTENCRQNCERHWYDSTVKRGKNFAKWIGLSSDDSSTAITQSPKSNDKSLQSQSTTIVQILIPLQSDLLTSNDKNIFITEKCETVDFYFFAFNQCCANDEIFWLYLAIFVGWLILIISLFWNIYFCIQKIKAAKKKRQSDSDSGDYWCYQDLKPSKSDNEDENDYPRLKRVLRRVSKRRHASGKSDEIYATIKSRASTRPLKITPISQIPYITVPTLSKPSSKGIIGNVNGSSIEENPAYVCQIIAPKSDV